MVSKQEITDWLKSLQKNICSQLEDADKKAKFIEDVWDRPGGGGGTTMVITNGNVIEKGGVNFSAVYGKTPQGVLQTLNINASGDVEFYATGVSIVIHPFNPMLPIIHMNVRYFELSNGTWWFGGGMDLTPHYVSEDDARYFHRQLKEVCDRHHTSYYEKFKQWADDYFFIRHRDETRGIGGIFFDHLKEDDSFTKDSRFSFLKDVAEAFAPMYIHFMNNNSLLPYTDQNRKWQMLRRGRYVEFNLVWDRGTKFGLETDGRTESILMSLPPHAEWLYNYYPEKNSPEEKTLHFLRKGINWI